MKSFGVTGYANKTFPAALPHLILAHFTEKNIFLYSTEYHIWSLRRLNLRLWSAL